MHAGIDTHKDTLAVAVVDDNGRQQAARTVRNESAGFGELAKLLADHGVMRVGVECSGTYGRPVATALTAAGFEVFEVPGSMTVRERNRKPSRGKTDPDRRARRRPGRCAGRAAAAGALRGRSRRRPAAADPLSAPTGQRTHARVQPHPRRPDHPATRLSAQPAATHPPRAPGRRAQAAARTDRCPGRDHPCASRSAPPARRRDQDAGDPHQRDGARRGNEPARDPRRRTTDRGTHHRRDPRRPPLPRPQRLRDSQRHRADPGQQRTQRQVPAHRAGNRRLNEAIHTIALVQSRAACDGRAFLDRKKTSGKTGREAVRSLKRRLSDVVYTALHADLRDGIGLYATPLTT